MGLVVEKTNVEERALRNWFEKTLLTDQGFRAQALGGPGESEEVDKAVLALLDDAHLIRGDDSRGARWYELAHDRLIEPMQESNRAWRETHQSPLQSQAAIWLSQQRPFALLATGRALQEAEAWASDNPGDVGQAEKEFLEASRHHHELATGRSRRAKVLWATSAAVFLAVTIAIALVSSRSARELALAIGSATVLSLAPFWVYVIFIRTKTSALYDEYVLNLFRLRIDEYANLPAPPPGTRYYELWARERKARGGVTRDNIYISKFESFFGRGVSTLEVRLDRRRVSPLLRTILSLLPLTLVLLVGWFFALLGALPDSWQVSNLRQFLLLGFLGAYVFMMQTLLRRYHRGDLKQSAYISATFRLVTLCLVAIVLYPLTSECLSPGQAATVAFLLGFFPSGGIQVTRQLVASLLTFWAPKLRGEYPLAELDGVNIWYEAHLVELGIEDMQNLATANIVDLLLIARIPVGRLVDWIDQAALLLRLPRVQDRDGRRESGGALHRQLGVRTATDLERVSARPEADHAARALGRVLDVPVEEAHTLLASILLSFENDVNLSHVRAFRHDAALIEPVRVEM